jgi:hypothetical protein
VGDGLLAVAMGMLLARRMQRGGMCDPMRVEPHDACIFTLSDRGSDATIWLQHGVDLTGVGEDKFF